MFSSMSSITYLRRTEAMHRHRCQTSKLESNLEKAWKERGRNEPSTGLPE